MQRPLRARPPRARTSCPDDCEPGCPTCAAREYAVFPYADLNAEQWAHLRFLLTVRSGGSCEGCGHPFAPGAAELSVHHRRSRNMGGTDDPCIHGLANLVALCGGRMAGVQGCHGEAEHNRAHARDDRGLLVSWGAYRIGAEPPEVSVPLRLPSGRRVLLDTVAAAYLPVPGDTPGPIVRPARAS